MKLRTKFSVLAIWITIQMLVLAGGLVYNSNRAFALKNYQFVLAQTQYDVADISDYINKVMYHGADLDQLYGEWTKRLQRTTADFQEVENDPVRTKMSGDMDILFDQLSAFWLILNGRFKTFDNHLKNISDAKVPQDTRIRIGTEGLMIVWQKLKDDESMKDLSFEVLVINSEIKTLQNAKESLAQVVDQVSKNLKVTVDRQMKVVFATAIISSIVSSILLLIIILTMTSRIIKRVQEIEHLSSNLAGKDLTERSNVRGHDEIGGLMKNFNNTVAELNHFILIVQRNASKALTAGYEITDSTADAAAAIAQINRSIESMTRQFELLGQSVESAVNSSAQIDTVVNTLVQNNSQQAHAISESNTAVHAVAKTLETISQNARDRTKSAEEMQVLVADGDSKISSTNEILARITSQLDEVSEIVTIINTIAQQTNMLSMNAAIESAHAGEAGKGFSVVADEIRKLAESTSDNAKQINASINGIVEKVKEANESSSTAAEAFEKVNESAKTMLNSFQDISSGIASIDDQTKQITTHTTSIAGTADMINQYCDNLAEQQKNISKVMSLIKDIFAKSMTGINEIRVGTQDIVSRIQNVSAQGNVSYEKMTELKEALSEFKTDDAADSEAQDTEKAGETDAGHVPADGEPAAAEVADIPAAESADTLPVTDDTSASGDAEKKV